MCTKMEWTGNLPVAPLGFDERAVFVFFVTRKTLFVDLPKGVLTDPEKAFTRINIAMKQDIAIADREQYGFSIFIKCAEIISAPFFMRIFAVLALDVDRKTPVPAGDVQKFVYGFDICDTVTHKTSEK